MDWLDWLKIGGGVVLLLMILGWYQERKEKCKEEMKEEDDFSDALRKNICPQCGTKGSLNELEDEYVSTPYEFKGMVTEEDDEQNGERRMQAWSRDFERAVGCTQCDYHKVYRYTLDYNVKEMADASYGCCPQCREKNSVYLKDIKTTDRYQANKEVEETTARGTKSRYIKITKVVEEETYACKNCDFTSVATVTRELK